MFGHYVVLELNGHPAPILISPDGDSAWDKPRKGHELDVEQVLGAGEIVWHDGTNPTVECSGAGIFYGEGCGDQYSRIRDSRETVDAALFHKALSAPMGYVVFKRWGEKLTCLLVPEHMTHSDALVAYYMETPSEVVVSAGVVDFGWASGSAAICSGNASFGTANSMLVAESRGAEDLVLLQQLFSKRPGDTPLHHLGLIA